MQKMPEPEACDWRQKNGAEQVLPKLFGTHDLQLAQTLEERRAQVGGAHLEKGW